MNFFKEQQGAAVIKHGVLQRYLPTFVSKTGSKSRHHRVVYVDGFAGPGAYDDGTPGSPVLAARTARKVQGINRQLRCLYVEQRRKYCEALRRELAPYPHDFEVFHGTIEDHLDAVLREAAETPLLAFFDPFGLGLAFNQLLQVMGRPTWPPAEVLLNFSFPGLRRNAGKRSQPQVLARIDEMLGGDWWRPLWESDSADREYEIASQYVERVKAAAGSKWSSWTVPVPRRWRGPPVYVLMFFTRHPDGIWAFNECLSGAMEDFHNYCFEGQQDLLEEVEWVDEIRTNVTRLLTKDGSFNLAERLPDVYGAALGRAREKHLKAAIKQLHYEGATATSGVGNLKTMRIYRRPAANR